MDLFTLLALACLLAAVVLAFVQRAWPMVLLSAGMFFVVLTSITHVSS